MILLGRSSLSGGFSVHNRNFNCRGILLALTLLTAGAFSATLFAGNPPAPIAPPAERNFVFNYVVHVPATPGATRKLRLWMPMPQSDAYQRISELSVESTARHSVHKESEYHNEFLYFEADPDLAARGFNVKLQVTATRHEHRVDLTGASSRGKSAKPSQSELKRYLQPDRLVPITGQIDDLGQEQTKGLTDPLEKARAIYRYVVATMSYDKSGQGWGRGDAIYACTIKKGNCTDFHSLFIGMLRSQGIPARFEMGFSVPETPQAGKIGGYHCWAEFYLQDRGWVPVDASEAWKNPPLRDYFFGAHDANRIQFSMGRDLRLAPPQAGDPLNYSVYPYAELDGKPLEKIPVEFSFRDLSASRP